MSNLGEQISSHVLYRNGPLIITESVVWTWVAMALMIGFAMIATHKIEDVPTGVQNVTEAVLEYMRDMTRGNFGSEAEKFFGYATTIGIFCLVANLMGLIPGVKSPTADLNTTLSIAVGVFFVAEYTTISYHGFWAYIKGYFDPIFVMMPMNVAGALGATVSHALRLFCNMVGGAIVTAILGSFMPVGFPLVLNAYFGVFAGVVQAYIFYMLAMVYISIKI